MNKPIEEIELLGCREAFEANTLKEAESQPIKKDWLAKKPNGNYLEPSVYSAYQGWKACWQYRTPSLSYAYMLERATLAVLPLIHDRTDIWDNEFALQIARAALAAIDINPEKDYE